MTRRRADPVPDVGPDEVRRYTTILRRCVAPLGHPTGDADMDAAHDHAGALEGAARVAALDGFVRRDLGRPDAADLAMRRWRGETLPVVDRPKQRLEAARRPRRAR